MTLTLISHWLVAIVGIFSTGFAIPYPSLDQYSERNHYRIPHYKLQDLENQITPLKGLPTDDVIVRKQRSEKWSPLRSALDHGGPYEREFPSLDDSYSDYVIFLDLKRNASLDRSYSPLVTYITKLESDWLEENSGTIWLNGKIHANGKKGIFNDRTNKESLIELENSPRKRSSVLLNNGSFTKEIKERIVPTMSLRELLTYWGIDTSDEKATVRSQRGDIEVREQIPPKHGGSSARGDVPASLRYTDELMPPQRRKRDLTYPKRKLLWSRQAPETDVWGFAEDDGLLLNDQASSESNERDIDNEREHIKGYRRHGKNRHPTNYEVHDNDNVRDIREKIVEEERRQWEAREKKRDDERRRRIEDEQRRIDEEQRRRDEEQRRNEQELRRKDEEQRRSNVARRRNDRERGSNDLANSEYNIRDGNREPHASEDETHEARLRQWQRTSEEHDRLMRAKGNNRNRENDGKSSQQDLENERKLQDYIRRNTPIAIAGGRNRHRFQPPASLAIPMQRRPEDPANRPNERSPVDAADKRLQEYRKRIEDERNHRGPHRGQPEEQTRRRQEEYRRRQQEEERLREFTNERSRDRGEEGIHEDDRDKHQPGDDEDERARENEEIRQAENQKRLYEEQGRRYEEQIRRDSEELRGIKASPIASQRYATPHREEHRESGKTTRNEEKRPTGLYGIFDPEEAIGSGMRNHRYRNFQRPPTPSESYEKNRIDNRHRQPQADVVETSGHPSTRKQPVESVSGPRWGERPEAMTPAEIKNRRMLMERARQEEEKRRENEVPRTPAVNEARGQSRQGPPDRRNNVDGKEWSPTRQDIPKEHQVSQMQEQRRREDETRERYLEFKNSQSQYLTDNQRNEEEEERLRNLPVSATIIIRGGGSNAGNNNGNDHGNNNRNNDNGSDNRNNDNNGNDNGNNTDRTTPIEITARNDFGDTDIDFPGIGPFKKGIEVQDFQRAPPTRQSLVESPKACIWSIVICCNRSNAMNPKRLRMCFEGTNCPGANWDTDRCSDQKVKTANKEIMEFYLSGQQSSNPTSFRV